MENGKGWTKSNILVHGLGTNKMGNNEAKGERGRELWREVEGE